MKKKTLFMIAIAALVLAILAGGTAAYYTLDDVAHNIITTADGLHGKIVEEDGEGNPFEDVEGAMPGDEIGKVVYIKNTGETPYFVRIKVTKSIELAEGVVGTANPDYVTIMTDGKEGFNTAKWTQKGDFWYYNGIVEPGKSTEPLFTDVKLSGDMDNMYAKCQAKVDVSAQMVQSANNGDSALNAAGWPAE